MITAEQRTENQKVDRYYVGYLKDSLSVIDRAIKHAEEGAVSDPAVIRAEVVAHKIKGNAALYDLPELGEIAKGLEAALKGQEPADVILPRLIDFASAMRVLIKTDLIIEDAQTPQPIIVKPSPVVIPVEAPCAQRTIVGRKVLMVFEDPWFEDFIGTYFVGGVDIHTRRSCAEAITWLAANTADLIVCESDLPDTPGTAFMQFLRNASGSSAAPFLIVFPDGSGFDEMSEAIAAGASAILDTKTDAMRLAEQMRDLLSSSCRRVLIIDDDDPVRELLQHTFSRAGYTTDTARDGIDALLRIAVNKPDLIILDRLMPRMNGEATLRELRASVETGSIPVIVLTAMDNVGEASKWLMRGASEFIAKPFDPEEVLARAQKLLRSQKAG